MRLVIIKYICIQLIQRTARSVPKSIFTVYSITSSTVTSSQQYKQQFFFHYRVQFYYILEHSSIATCMLELIYFYKGWPMLGGLFVCVEVLRPSQPNGVMSSAVSLPKHTFTGKA